jgi:hypothetical protein
MQSEFTKEKPTAGQTKFCWKKMLRKRGREAYHWLLKSGNFSDRSKQD